MNKLTVTLTHEDIADLTNNMNDAFSEHEKPSQGHLEYLLFSSIRKVKNVDFFEEERKIAEQEEENNKVMQRDMEREIYLRCDEEDRKEHEEPEQEIKEGMKKNTKKTTYELY
jgi:hypothetical protein